MKTKASMGFQAIVLLLIFMTTLRSGTDSLMSYKMMERSLAQAPAEKKEKKRSLARRDVIFTEPPMRRRR